ncbi:MAG: RHS repeat-associated core domain-containing protein, partial [Anaerolineae bacterium]|nr:RHS repeat-associated core domain-containing protein [Anaerolineae bacterium]
SYTYDNNGNMIERVEDGTTWTLTYNEENRLESVSAVILSQTNEWISTYDGDGTRVKQVHKINSVVQTTNYYYMGGIYEVEDDGTTQTTTRYYGIGGKRVAMHDGTTLSYFLTDKQGSTIAVLDTGGTILSEQRYKPFGEVRDDVGTITETDFGYTGQRNIPGADLMNYNARYYSPELGRFTQPDTITPSLTNPQSLNRYAYVSNNPARYIDPSGHLQYEDLDDEGCSSTADIPEKGDRGLTPEDPGYCNLHSETQFCKTEKGKEEKEKENSKKSIPPGFCSEKPWHPACHASDPAMALRIYNECPEFKNGQGFCGARAAYTTFEIGLPIGWFIGMPFFGIHIEFTQDYNGNWYFGIGPDVGQSTLIPIDIAYTWAYPGKEEDYVNIEDFIGGIGYEIGISTIIYIGGDFNWPPFKKGGGGAVEIGIATPQLGAGITLVFPITSWND